MSRFSVTMWKMLNNFLQPSAKINPARGSYILDTLGHCNECHTPRNSLGMLQMDKRLTGNESLSAPDISAAILKDWKTEELTDLFSDGVLPSGDYLSDHMAEVVEFSTSHWKQPDLKAAIHYLTTQ